MQSHSWDNFRFVLAVFRYETLSAAARSLAVNETTVSRRLAQVEEQLQTKLFSRSPSGLEPTDAGLLLVQYVERAEAEIDTGRKRVTGSDKRVSGGVRIAADPLLINHLLVPRLMDLMVQHPELKIDLIAANERISVARHEADIAIQLDKPENDPRVFQSHLGELTCGVYASARLASVSKSHELPWLSHEGAYTDLPIANWVNERIQTDNLNGSRVIVNNLETLLRCLHANLGKSLLPDILAANDEGLTRLESSEALPVQEVWLACQPELRDIGRIKATLQWLDDCLSHATLGQSDLRH